MKKKLGRPKKPLNKKYVQHQLKLPPNLVEWLNINTDNKNGFIVLAIKERITKTVNKKE